MFFGFSINLVVVQSFVSLLVKTFDLFTTLPSLKCHLMINLQPEAVFKHQGFPAYSSKIK